MLRQEIADGRKVRLLYVLGPATREVEGDAMKADTDGFARGMPRRRARRRVSDED